MDGMGVSTEALSKKASSFLLAVMIVSGFFIGEIRGMACRRPSAGRPKLRVTS
jgi:hypothetical protein